MRYTEEEEKELNAQLGKWQRRAKRLILSDYYDCIADRLNDLNYTALTAVTNAETHKDINFSLWNSGLIESTLDRIAELINEARRENRKGGRK
ncbi:hypothetical protein [Bacteroides sp.]|uniref:hypothetical protein n=1 Tax=Bacteroides sp. TaxID=29523 RepID=UPI00261CCA46|nr:hypothetical protein [Bacteroides sp.]MDD3040536.1 hypothetical protein [Bacteroides sp.]